MAALSSALDTMQTLQLGENGTVEDSLNWSARKKVTNNSPVSNRKFDLESYSFEVF